MFYMSTDVHSACCLAFTYLFFLMIPFYVPTKRRQMECYGPFLQFSTVKGQEKWIESKSFGNIWVSPNMQYIFVQSMSPSYVIYWRKINWIKLKH